MDINKFYESYEKPEFIDERLENVVSALVIARGKGFNEDLEKQQQELKRFFFKTLNDVVMTPEMEMTFPIWVFDNVEKVTDYNEYNSRLVIDENLDNIVEDDNVKLHWRVIYYDKNKNLCDSKKPQNISYRILEVIFEY